VVTSVLYSMTQTLIDHRHLLDHPAIRRGFHDMVTRHGYMVSRLEACALVALFCCAELVPGQGLSQRGSVEDLPAKQPYCDIVKQEQLFDGMYAVIKGALQVTAVLDCASMQNRGAALQRYLGSGLSACRHNGLLSSGGLCIQLQDMHCMLHCRYDTVHARTLPSHCQTPALSFTSGINHLCDAA